jgi:hypothetical protein
MAFSTTTISGLSLQQEKSPLLDQLTSAMAANCSSLSVVGGVDCLSRAIGAFLDVYRKDPVASLVVSAAKSLSVEASSTASLLVLKVQF